MAKRRVRHVKCIFSFREDETKVKIQLVDSFHGKPDVYTKQLQVRMLISVINSPTACSLNFVKSMGNFCKVSAAYQQVRDSTAFLFQIAGILLLLSTTIKSWYLSKVSAFTVSKT